MIVEIHKLNQTKGGTDFSYNDKAEDAISNAICYFYDLQANGGTVGFDPSYDKLINHTKVEIKISSSSAFYLEIAKGNGEPSGIFASNADIYMTVTPGTDKGNQCMKVKVYNKMVLQHWAKHMLDNHPDKLKTYPPSKMGPGSSGFILDYTAVDDLYILGFEYVKDSNGYIIFDTHNVVNRDRVYAKKNITKFIP